ncbi:MAG TPA: nitrous oxide reductase family maturation protein NosD [Vicinamibacteria bacterium]|nr:nitrous oxide reductase family maturation protein NosD [Vicinamibacteria bacterium]
MRIGAIGAVILLGLGVPARAQVDDGAVALGQLEGRPARSDLSPLQARVDEAPAGSTVVVPPGTYRGDLFLDRPITLRAGGDVTLIGSGHGSVLRVRAPGVTIEGFTIDGQKGGDLGRDSSGIHVTGADATIRRCRIRNAIFGVYLRESSGTVVEDVEIVGIPGLDPGEKGSGIHLWNSQGFRLERNVIRDVRDGFYVQSSAGGVIRGNRVSDVRYGLHYMFSDDNLFEDNVFENGAAGAALMYSQRIVFRRNQFIRNRGFASVGLLLKACDDVLAEDNLLADNARGIFMEGSSRNIVRRNVIAGSDAAVVLYDSVSKNQFESNSFVSNRTPLLLVGTRTDTIFTGNYYTSNLEPDLDGDGASDRAFTLGSVFDHFRGNVIAADLMVDTPAAEALGLAERTFPVLRKIAVADDRPLAKAPLLPAVPVAARARGAASRFGIAISAALMVVALAGFHLGQRPGGAS